MSYKLLCCCCFVLSSLASFATPSPSSSISEKFVGSNENGFVILRTEYINKGSHYEHYYKKYLDFYVKERVDPKDESSPMKLESSKLILEKSVITINSPKIEEKIQFQDKEVSFAEVMKKTPYELRPLQSKIAETLNTQKWGTQLAGVTILSSSRVKQKFGYERDKKEFDWELLEISKDYNSYYIKIREGADSFWQQRYICILPEKFKQVNDRFNLDQIVITAGEFKEKEKAVELAQDLNKKARDMKFHNCVQEVWLKKYRYSEQAYVVVTTNSEALIKKNKLGLMEKTLEHDFGVEGSQLFSRKIEIPIKQK